MKKWFIILAAVAVMAALLVPAFGATKTIPADKQKEIDQLWQQMYTLRTQILQKYVDAGVITKEQADAAKNRMKQMYELRKQNGYLPGSGMCGNGAGAGTCGGGGCGGRFGGYQRQYAPQNNNIY